MHTHDVYPGTLWTYDIWAHGECLRFATTNGAAITIWEVGFTQGATRREIETLSVPNDADQAGAFDLETKQHARRTQFFPIPCRLAFTRPSSASTDELLVWGARNSASLLHETSASWYPGMSFSSDGRFFACSTTGLEVCLWKESSTGYTLIGKLPSNTRRSIPLLSPNGESIITFGDRTIQLWHTKAFTTPSGISAHVPHCAEDFVLEFVPDRQLAVVARKEEKTVAVLDLKSGLPQLTIDASMEVYSIRVIENTVVVAGDGRAITWDLPKGNFLPHTRVGVENSTQTTHLSDELKYDMPASLDLPHIALMRRNPIFPGRPTLSLYCLSTGRPSYTVFDEQAKSFWFPPGENSFWYANDGLAVKKIIIDIAGSPGWTYSAIDINSISSACPWRSSSFYKVTDDGWLMDPDGKRLFMFPPPWRSYTVHRIWNGQFLALLHGALPQPVILDLAP